MIVTASCDGDSRRLRVTALGLRYFGGRAVYAAPSPPAQIFTGEW